MTWTMTHQLMVRLRAWTKHLLYRLLDWLPLPAQDKWSRSLQLLRLQLRLFPQAANERLGSTESERMTKKALEETGRQLVTSRFNWSSPPAPDMELVRDTYTVLVKTLNLPSHINIAQEKVTITTFHCPFLEDARTMNEKAANVCERVCGQRRSLFKGTVEGFPFFMSYQAPLMMGHGDNICVKEIQLLKAPAAIRRPGRRRSAARRPRYLNQRLPIPERERYLHKLEAEAAAQESDRQAGKES